ncbi:unnamed protein product [Spirodela intermedia]|uniref:Flavanone 4-reductase n=1 Tax=Spirodela intermedia TaxID=51605 RepID=A0A7I8JMD0_SPIIN|nr:unnamed protein product [Spirodela intermedia]CAA6671260.1 unnamed protein product [Spirodela intermedia]
MGETKGPVVVTGAAGFIGSWLVMRLLEKGYAVRATVRDPKGKALLDLPNSKERLTLWRAELSEEGSFDEAIAGCSGVFHAATPMDFESDDPENEVIKPTIDGVLNVLRSCDKAGTVKRVVFTSSAGSVNVVEHPKSQYEETDWSDFAFIRRVKMTGWMYFLSKALAEKAAWDFAAEKGIDLITIIPTLVVGLLSLRRCLPVWSQRWPCSQVGNKAHYSILKQIQFVHLDDLCNSLIFLLNHPEASGRFISSSHDTTIFELAELMRGRYPEYDIPTEFEEFDVGEDKSRIDRVHFSSRKLKALGFQFQYTLEEMLDGAIQSCRERKLLKPRTAEPQLEMGTPYKGLLPTRRWCRQTEHPTRFRNTINHGEEPTNLQICRSNK